LEREIADLGRHRRDPRIRSVVQRARSGRSTGLLRLGVLARGLSRAHLVEQLLLPLQLGLDLVLELIAALDLAIALGLVRAGAPDRHVRADENGDRTARERSERDPATQRTPPGWSPSSKRVS